VQVVIVEKQEVPEVQAKFCGLAKYAVVVRGAAEIRVKK